MATYAIGMNDPKTIKKFSVALAAETFQKSFWGKNFIGTSESSIIQRLTDLEREAGDTMTVDLFNNLTGSGVSGDETLKGNEEAMSSATQQMWIDQLRHGVSVGGRMSRKRSSHDVRLIAKKKLAIWWGRMFDEALFVYLAGTRGAETGDWLMAPSTVTAGTTKLYSNNIVTGYHASRVIPCSTTNTTIATMTSDDVMTLASLQSINYELKTMANPPTPLMIDGEESYIVIMHPKAEKDLRTETGEGGWAEIQKYSQKGQAAILRNSLGRVGKLVLYSHNKIPVGNDGGTETPGEGDAICYNMLLGAQAGFLAHGNTGAGMHFDWHEEVDDRGNKPVIDTGSIFGVQRSIYDSVDFGAILIPSYHSASVS